MTKYSERSSGGREECIIRPAGRERIDGVEACGIAQTSRLLLEQVSGQRRGGGVMSAPTSSRGETGSPVV